MSGVTTRLTVGYVRERAGEQAVAAVLARAGERRTVAELEDERGWSSYAQWLALLEAAVAVVGDRDTARRIGASVVSQRVGGPAGSWSGPWGRSRPCTAMLAGPRPSSRP